MVSNAEKRKSLCSVFNPILDATEKITPKSLHSFFREHALVVQSLHGLY
jgi:hypothetical protein